MIINSLGDSDSLEHTPESEALELRLTKHNISYIIS
jgi:hypothetical protein